MEILGLLRAGVRIAGAVVDRSGAAVGAEVGVLGLVTDRRAVEIPVEAEDMPTTAIMHSSPRAGPLPA